MKKLLLLLFMVLGIVLTTEAQKIQTLEINSDFYKVTTVTVQTLPDMQIFNSNQIYYNTPVNIPYSTLGTVIINPYPISVGTPTSLYGTMHNSYLEGYVIKPIQYDYIESFIKSQKY